MARKKREYKILKEAKEVLSPFMLKSLNGRRLGVGQTSNDMAKTKYSRKASDHRLIFVTGFDLMQFTIVVKPFICKKHRIKTSLELEILLYLYPIQYFNIKDFKYLPVSQFSYNLKTLIDLGHLELLVQHKNGHQANIYGLTDRAKRAVRDYYFYLSGEKTLKDKTYTAPFKNIKKSKIENQRKKVMMKLKRQSELQPSLFIKGGIL